MYAAEAVWGRFPGFTDERKCMVKGMENYRIRAHHGMCLAFFKGRGYSGEFVEHMDIIKRALEKNPKVCIVAETDKICGHCPNNSFGICTNGDKVAGYDWKTLELCGLEAGTEMDWKEFEGLVKENILDAGKRKSVCGDCQWDSLCYRNISEDA